MFYNFIIIFFGTLTCKSFFILNSFAKLENLLVVFFLFFLFLILKKFNYLTYFAVFDLIFTKIPTLINKNLLNGVMNVHPMLYIFIVIQFCIIYIAQFSNKKTTFNINYVLKLLAFLLILGSFWAAQELSWGGWWSWDITECTILYIFLYIIYNYHFYINNFFFLKRIILLFFLFFLFNKTTYILSVHAFSTNFDNNYIILLLFTITFIIFFKVGQLHSFLIIIFLFYCYIYMNVLLILILLYYIFFNKNLLLSLNFSVFTQIIALFSVKHLFFFFLIFNNITFYCTVTNTTFYITIFSSLYNFGFDNNLYLLGKSLTNKLYHTNTFYFPTQFWFPFFNIGWIHICTLNFYIILFLFFYKKKKKLFL